MQLYNTNVHYKSLYVVNINEDAILSDAVMSLHKNLLVIGCFGFVSNVSTAQF
jgi:hypothetical protein